MLVLRSLFFALLIPGTVTVVVPYLLVAPRMASVLAHWGLPQYVGLLPMVAGAAILIRCIRDLAVIGRGTLAHVDPPQLLVVQGLYRYVRNPMYVGALLFMLGEALMLQSVAILEWATIWLLGIHCVVVFYEEPSLRRQFGEPYEQYRRAVRRWIPGPPFRGAT
jgi:protein-S-isoprenylcysteine O-methyltransferase Ste14